MALGLPSISVKFIQEGVSAIKRGSRGIVAMIIKETEAADPVTIATKADIPTTVTATNKDLIVKSLIGNTNAPTRLELFVIGGDVVLADALNYFENTQFDYLCYPDADETEKTTIVTFIEGQRELGNMVKAVLAKQSADSEGIINVTQDGVKVGTTTYDAGAFTARVAGLLAGTDLRLSATYAELPEVDSIPSEKRNDTATKIGNGELVLFSEAGKVKVARAVNSLTTTAGDKGTLFQKIKTVDIMDLIANDIRRTARDSYLGKYSNSYDNKCLLVVAIQEYMQGLERDGLVEKNTTTVEIDLEAQRNFLKNKGIAVARLTDQEIKEANTEDEVFISVKCKILDAIESISIRCFI